MNSLRFDVLAALVLSGEATEKEQIEFESMLDSSKENQIVFEKIKRVWNTELMEGEQAYHKQNKDLWQKYQLERKSARRRSLNNPFFMVAASVVLLIIAGLILFPLNTQPPAAPVAKEIIKKTKAGEKLKTMLPDGTMVYLNSGSQLTFPQKFQDSERVVHLIGEGYFEVAEDKSRPFTVKTKSMDIIALGTAFAVNVASSNHVDLVALVSGKLLITNLKEQKIKIDSGYTVKLTREDHNFIKSEIDYLTEIAWKDGSLHFENNSFTEIVETLQLNYGVEFIFDQRQHQINNTYTGTFKNESLDNILKILSFSMNFNYEINGKKVIIRAK